MAARAKKQIEAPASEEKEPTTDSEFLSELEQEIYQLRCATSIVYYLVEEVTSAKMSDGSYYVVDADNLTFAASEAMHRASALLTKYDEHMQSGSAR